MKKTRENKFMQVFDSSLARWMKTLDNKSWRNFGAKIFEQFQSVGHRQETAK